MTPQLIKIESSPDLVDQVYRSLLDAISEGSLAPGQRITQEELADRCGMFRTYMSRIESGLANPTLTMLHALAKGLDVDIQELFVQVQTPPPVRSARCMARRPCWGSGKNIRPRRHTTASKLAGGTGRASPSATRVWTLP